MNYCSKCGKERIDGSSLCGNCGSTDVPITYKKKYMVVANIINVVLFAMLFVDGYLALRYFDTVRDLWIFLILFINSAILSLIFSIISKHKFTLYASIFVLSLIFFLFFSKF